MVGTAGQTTRDDNKMTRTTLLTLAGMLATGSILHELGHVLCLAHTHQRADRDQHVVVVRFATKLCFR